jgi:hypothetical protein
MDVIHKEGREAKRSEIMPTVQEEINQIKEVLARFEKIGSLDEKVVLNDLKAKVDEMMTKLDAIITSIAFLQPNVYQPYTLPQITWLDKTQARGSFTINDVSYTVSKSG